MDLLATVRQFLNITWEDEALDNQLNIYINSSKDFLNKVAGVDELDYESAGLPQDLLLNRVLYMNSHNLNDFGTNYICELNRLRIEHAKLDEQSNS